MSKLTELEQVIGYEFNEQRLLQQALTHSSFANEKHMKKLSDNERLEFLGDAVLEVVSSEFLYKEHTDLPEGDLTKLRASIVCEPTLALCTREIDLGKYLYLGKGENLTGGRGRKSILSDALEAVIGAIYLDGGFEPAKAFIHRFILTDIEHKKLFYNAMIEQQLPIGVIQFDVNNLKYMNDTFGHEKGDELIKLTAEGLKNSFQRFGRCYRMGGDEFLVVLTGNDPEADYRLGIQLLHSYCNEINQTNMSDFSFEVAHGFVLSKGQVLEDVIKEADGKMYHNKRILKHLL